MAEPRRRPRFEEKLNVAAIYRTQFFTAVLIGWVTSQRQQGMNIEEAIRGFQKYFGIEDEDTDSLRRLYHYKNKQLQHTLSDEGGLVILVM